MAFKSIIGATCACLTIISFNTSAALLERLGGLAYYDDVANLTWMADAYYAKTSGFDADGVLTWGEANAWAAGLDVAGVTGWRLPDTLQPDASCDSQSSIGSGGFSCTGSEMGNLTYNVLGGVANRALTLTHNDNYNLFSNVNAIFWSATEDASNTTRAWSFGTWSNTFQQGVRTKSGSGFAWAVRSGDVNVVPIPAAVWLFGSGLIGLIGLARRKT